MTIHIIIPTYRWSAKLYRLFCSYSLWKQHPQIHLIDSSTDRHLKSNKNLCHVFGFVKHYCFPSNLSFSPRLLEWLESNLNDNDIIFLGNDEDLFLEDFCKKAYNIMSSNIAVSTVIGSYITSLTPFLRLFPQVSFKRLVPFNYSISGSVTDKISTFMFLNSTSRLPPLFFGPRRKYQLFNILKKVVDLPIKQSTEELIDQFILLEQGDVQLISSLMLIRDETRVNYVIEPIRMDENFYISTSDMKHALESITCPDEVHSLVHSYYYPAINSNSIGLASSYFKACLHGYSGHLFSSSNLIRITSRLLNALTLRIVYLFNFIIAVFAFIPFNAKSHLLGSSFFPLSVNKTRTFPG